MDLANAIGMPPAPRMRSSSSNFEARTGGIDLGLFRAIRGTNAAEPRPFE
jgi:hypothetical protein